MHIPFDNTYAQLPNHFFTKQTPAQVPAPELIHLNDERARELSIDTDWLTSDSAVATFSGNEIPQGSTPISQAYAGHQFGGFSPQLGDGRAILLGEVLDTNHQRYDIQLKGSGRTAFSRGGDGKSALGPVIREYLVSEAMYALGVPTTRALAAVTTGETVLRQEGPVPGGVFTRVASSHIRVGTFQYFLAREDHNALKILADYTIARHYPEATNSSSPYQILLESVIKAQANLIAQWMSLGFIHGVMNTDNCTVSGETIDYGPCAFIDTFHPNKVFSSIDTQGRYAWGNQGNIGMWNLSRFAETLLPLLSENSEEAIDIAESSLSTFPTLFREQYDNRFRSKLGLPQDAPQDIIQDCLELLTSQKIDFTLFFRHLTQFASPSTTSARALESLFPNQSTIHPWLKHWHALGGGSCLSSMQKSNPILIPRNHRIEQAIQDAYQNDFNTFDRLLTAFKKPYTEIQEFADLETPPTPDQVVHTTFCGT